VADKDALRMSSAGMRLIALLTIYNADDSTRLRAFIAGSLHADLLAHADADTRVAGLSALRTEIGKLRVRQVVGAAKEQVIVILASERADDALIELRVDADYPHPITELGINRLGQPTDSPAT